MLAMLDIPWLPPDYQLPAKAIAALAGVLLGVKVWRSVARFRRRRRPVQLHPKLAKYGIDSEEASRRRRALAAQIAATSSGPSLVGYEIVEQIDAVFVEGFRSPAEAIEGLKAEAASRRANAVINVRQERTAAGRCSASGDAVKARRLESS